MEPEAIGNPVTHTFASGASYTFQELTLRQQGQIQTWIRNRRLKMGLDALGKDATSDDRAAVIRAMLKPIDQEDIQAELSSLDGILQALWLASDAAKKGLSAEQFGDSLGNVGIPELVVLVDIIQGGPALGEEGGEDAESGPNSTTDTTAKAAS